jgi:hypothetical protein
MRMSVIEWLLDSDLSIRWQVMRDLLGESDARVARERSRVAAEGWGARLLDLQGADGHWGGAAFVPHAWISTEDTLQLLRDLTGLPAAGRRRTRRADGRGNRSGAEEAGLTRALAAREPASGSGARRDGRPRRRAEPLEHAASAPRAALGECGLKRQTSSQDVLGTE